VPRAKITSLNFACSPVQSSLLCDIGVDIARTNATTYTHTHTHTHTRARANKLAIELFKYTDAECTQFSEWNPRVIRSHRSQKPKYSFSARDDIVSILMAATYWKRNCQLSKIFINHKRLAVHEFRSEKRAALSAVQSPLGRLLLRFLRTVRHSAVAVDRAAWKNCTDASGGYNINVFVDIVFILACTLTS